MKRKIITLCTALFALGIHAQISTPMWENFFSIGKHYL